MTQAGKQAVTDPVLSAEQKQQLVLQANRAAAQGDCTRALSILRQLSLQEFSALLLDIPEFAPALRSWLPSMPSDEVQRNWTGTCGLALLNQSIDFVRSLEKGSQLYQEHSIQGRVLDFGCGWGRITRPLLHYVNPEQIYGVDPWDVSIALCQQHHCLGQFAVGAYVPTSLPFAEKFDLIYVFSVFTHLSERTADAALQVLRRHIDDKGLLTITIRPPEYWDLHQGWVEGYSKELLKEQHQTQGFAFMPHFRAPINGDITYGDTSMSLDFINKRWPQWKIAGTDSNPSDPWQIVVFLQPA